MSNLIAHAKRELELAGLFDKTSEGAYGGGIGEAVMALVETHAKQGHSGGSHSLTMQVFNEVINFRPLTPIGTTPNEWVHVSNDERGRMFQNVRKFSCFSYDEGKTWYDIDEPGSFEKWQAAQVKP